MVSDISEAGMLLRFDEKPPSCEQIFVQAGAMEIRYQVRHSFERDGHFFTGVQAVV